MSAKGNLRVMKECLRERPMSTTEIKDVVNDETKYGISGSELKAFLNRRKDVFQKVGQETVERDTGCYTVDLWWLKELIQKQREKKAVPKKNKNEGERIIYPRWREPWSDTMWRTFLRLHLIEKKMQVEIYEIMGLRITQIHGAAKRYRNGEANKYVASCDLCGGVSVSIADDSFICSVCGVDKK